MTKPNSLYLLAAFVLSAMALSACGGALNAHAVGPNDASQNEAGTALPSQPPATRRPEVSSAPEGRETPEADNSHEVLGVVSAMDARSITINGVNSAYAFRNSRVCSRRSNSSCGIEAMSSRFSGRVSVGLR